PTRRSSDLRRGARHHGAQRRRQVHAGQHPGRPRRLRGQRRQRRVRWRRPARAGARGARRRRRVPGLPVPGRDPGREQHLLPAQRAQRAAQGARRARARLDAVPQGGPREAGRAPPRRPPAPPRRQRGLQRRREEAQRDFPDGRAGAQAGDPRRDRLGPGHRRPAPGGRRRERTARAGPRLPGDHPLPAPARLHQAGLRARAGRRPHRRVGWARTRAAARGARLRVAARAQGAGGHGVMAALLDSLAAGFRGDGARRAALDAALRDGLPHARAEAWKYTSLRALERRRFSPAPLPRAAVDPALVAHVPAPRLVFVNGRHDPALSDPAGLPEGARLLTMAAALADADPREANVLGRSYDRADEVFARLNAAFADDGAVLRIAEGVAVEPPVHLVFIGQPAEGDQAWHARHLLELRRGASATVVEHHLAGGDHAHLGNAIAHVHLAAGAALRHARIQDEAGRATLVTRTDAVLAREARYRRLDLELGAGLARHELNVRLEGDRAELVANGVLLAGGRRHLDTRLGIQHIARDTRCDLVWRGMADGRARAVFHGGIEI